MSLSLLSRGIVAMLCLGVEALAQPSGPASGVQFSWVRGQGAEGCPSAAALEGEVTARLGYSPFVGAPTQWIEGFVTADTGRYAVRLFERDASGRTLGTRTLAADLGDCSELGEATSLALALIVDPNATLKPLSPNMADSGGGPSKEDGARSQTRSDSVALGTSPARSSSGEAPPNAASSGSFAPDSPASPVATSSSRQTGGGGDGRDATASLPARADGSRRAVPRAEPPQGAGIALLSGWRSGTFPELALGVEFAAEGPVVRAIPLRYRLGMLYLPEQVVAHAAAKLGYTLTAGHLSACAPFHDSEDLRLSGCAGVEFGAINTVVYDPDPTQPGDRPWFSTRGDVAAQLRLWGPFRLEARAFLLVPLTRWTFRAQIDEAPKVLYEQKRLEPGAVFGLGAQIP